MTEEKMQGEARQAFLVNTLQKLLGQDSPTGFTERVVTVAEEIARELGFDAHRTNKGNLVITVPGRESGHKVGLCAHVDTLGLMVRSVTADGMLMVTKVGGPLLPTLDGEYCRIYTREGKVYTGTVLSLSPSVHVQDDAATRPRDEKNMAVRIDEKVHNKEDVLALGIVGFFRIETDIPGIGQNVLTDNQVVVPVSRCAELVFGQVGRRQLQQRAAMQLRGDPTAAVEHQDLQLPASADLVQQYRRHHQDDHQQRRQHGRQDKRPFPHPLVEFATDNQSYLTHGRFVQVVR